MSSVVEISRPINLFDEELLTRIQAREEQIRHGRGVNLSDKKLLARVDAREKQIEQNFGVKIDVKNLTGEDVERAAAV